MDEGACTFRYYNCSARRKRVLMAIVRPSGVSATTKPTRKEQKIAKAPENPTVRTQHNLRTIHRGHGTISSELLSKNLASYHSLDPQRRRGRSHKVQAISFYTSAPPGMYPLVACWIHQGEHLLSMGVLNGEPTAFAAYAAKSYQEIATWNGNPSR